MSPDKYCLTAEANDVLISRDDNTLFGLIKRYAVISPILNSIIMPYSLKGYEPYEAE